MTGLNREKRCKLAAVFVQNLLSVFTEVEYSFVREFLQFISRIYLFFRDLCIFFNAYGNGNHRARHAAAGLLAKTRYNFTRLRSVMFLHGPWTSGWQILSIVFIVIETVGLFPDRSYLRMVLFLFSNEWQTRSWLNWSSTRTPGLE